MERKTREEFLRFFKLDVGELECTSVLDGLIVLSQPEVQHQPAVAVGKISIGNLIRANYDLKAFGHWRLDLPHPERKTIEFREAAGSLDPSWIVVWARIASRIVEFCLRAGDEEFLNVLMRVLEAELVHEAEGISRYDVIDLLNDLGLSGEGKFVEENILMGDKNQFWFPGALREDDLDDLDNEDDSSGGTIMLPPE